MKSKGPLVSHGKLHICQHCGHSYYGRVCNNCGEKVFDEKTLSASHFFHEVIDFFFHFESKVLKTLRLNITKPGFVTKENFRGVRIPYAGPVQLYLVTAVIFFIISGKLGVSDYIPGMGDHQYFGISSYPALKWAAPLDQAVVDGIDSAWDRKERHVHEELVNNYYKQKDSGITEVYTIYHLHSLQAPDSIAEKMSRIEANRITLASFNNKVEGYGKTLVFLLLPLFAVFFFIFFRKKIKYYGAGLILATHFMVYNLCFFIVHAIIDFLPARLFGKQYGGILGRIIEFIFYNRYTEPVSAFLFGSSFEFLNIIFWMPWLYIAFRRLFNIPWWKDLLLSYACSKIFFFLIYSVFKKFLIAFAIWSVH